MKKKIIPLILFLLAVVLFSSTDVLAANRDKTIIINMNRTSLEYMGNIPILKDELTKRGYIGLMNIRGDGGNDDKRAYATIGAGRRANISSTEIINFENVSKDNKEIYINTTNVTPKSINLLSINRLIDYNLESGQYGATLGSIGETLSENNITVSALGNADTGTDFDQLNRNIGLLAMDNYGRIESGNVDNINVNDSSMPFGIRTDYDKLIEETKKLYRDSDVIFVELGDTHRLDLYKDLLNEETTTIMRKSIYSYINKYLKEVFELVNSNDKVYIMSAFPSNIDYQNKRRLSPVIKFDGNSKGLLYSPSTKRDGIVANVDIGVDILNNYVLKNDQTVGKPFNYTIKDDNVDYIKNEYNKIVSISNARTNIINFFVTFVSATWIIGILLVIFRSLLPEENRNKIYIIVKELLKAGMILPLSFLISPIYNFSTPSFIVVGIIFTTIIIYAIGYLLFKYSDRSQMLLYACITLIIIVIDCVVGTPLMKNSVLSYDAIVGARYYGMGNEYQGIVIGTTIFTFTTLLTVKNISRWLIAVISVAVLLTTASPSMGANVGASISEFIAFFTLILLIYNIKIDIKKILLIVLGVLGVIGLFVVIDIVSGSNSHLSLFVSQILENGPSAILETFTRKISMNLKLARTSIWVNILIIGITIIGILIFKPARQLMNISSQYPIIFKGFIANFIGCIVTLLVNDSGIVSAATASLYILIPVIIFTINILLDDSNV